MFSTHFKFFFGRTSFRNESIVVKEMTFVVLSYSEGFSVLEKYHELSFYVKTNSDFVQKYLRL